MSTHQNNGWIKLHRQVLDNAISSKPHYLALWIRLILLANHDENTFIWNNEKHICKRGQLLTGRLALSKESGIKEGTVESILNYLESQQQIQQQKTPKFRLITINNYDRYQKIEQQIQQQNDNRITTESQQNDTNKNEKNIKNIKNTTNVVDNGEKQKKEPTRIYRICRAYYKAKFGKELDEENPGIVKSFVSRNARSAKLLEPYPDDKIKMAIKHVRELSARSYDKGDGQGWDWSLETVLKKIDSLTAENSKQYE